MNKIILVTILLSFGFSFCLHAESLVEDYPEVSCKGIEKEIGNYFINMHISNLPNMGYLNSRERVKKYIGYYFKEIGNIKKETVISSTLFDNFFEGDCSGYHKIYREDKTELKATDGQINYLLFKSALMSLDPHSTVMSEKSIQEQRAQINDGSKDIFEELRFFDHQGELAALVRLSLFGIVEGSSYVSRLTRSTIATQFKKLVIDPKPKLKHIIIDLRGNPGGLIDEAINLAALFSENVVIKSQVIDASQEDLVLQKTIKPNYEGEVFKKKTLTILIDEASASSAELFAGTMQDLGRAVLVGEKSFGKSTIFLPWHRSNFIGAEALGAYQVTNGFCSLPSGRVIQAKGVTPDIEYIDQNIFYREIDMFPNAIENIDSLSDYRTPKQRQQQKEMALKVNENKQKNDVADPELLKIGFDNELAEKISLAINLQM